MQKRKVIVIGATGEIGGRIAGGCLRAGHQVVGVSRGTNKRQTADLTGVKMICGDKTSEPFIAELARLDYDAVIYSVYDLADIKRCAKHFKKARNVFLCGSTGVYVPLRQYPADETHPWREKTAVNFHQRSLIDACALDLWANEKFPVTILRPTNIIGPGRVPLELWGGRNIEFYKTLKRSEPLKIPPCGHILIQSGYNADLADAFVKALDYPDKVRGEIFNLSCKKAITLETYLRTARDYLKSRSAITTVPPEELRRAYPEIRWKGGLDFLLEHMCFDIGKAERTFGYCPKVTTEQGLVEALAWCESAGLL